MQPEQRLRELGIALPNPTPPLASYIPAIQTGSHVLISGQVPMVEGEPMTRGRVPDQVSEEAARECARRCAINGLAALKGEIGSLDRVRRVVRLGCFVNAAPEFARHPAIANGASDLMQEVFGEAGRHVRAAVGCSSLPLDVPVEIEFMFEVDRPGPA